VLTSFGEIPLYADDLWPEGFGQDLQKWWSRNIVFADTLERDEGLLHEIWLLEEIGTSPMRLIERWPDPCRADFMVLEPSRLDRLRDSQYGLDYELTSAFTWLTQSVQQHLGMPSEVRLVRWPSGQIESVQGRPLGKAPELEALEELNAKVSKCRSEPERQFFWAAVKAQLMIEPAFRVGRYELDFAYPQLQIGVEIDGYQFHSGYQQRERDYARERDLQIQGWKIVRFTAREVSEDPASCIRSLRKNMYISLWRFRQQQGT
jgi:very-short-patch-repair endonuclease